MTRTRIAPIAGAITSLAIALAAFNQAAFAHDHDGDVYWHIDPKVKSCSMQIDPSLTQGQWHTFTREAGSVISYKSLAPAAPAGRGNWVLGLDYSVSPVDQHDPAWINTFVHPDGDCPLGDAVVIPTLRGRVGVSERAEIGGFWTTSPNANFGIVGAELKYGLLAPSERRPSVALRASAALLTSVPDFDLAAYGADLVVGQRFGRFEPYVGVKQSLVVGSETTSKVQLHDEREDVTQGFAGTAVRVWRTKLAAEFDAGPVNTFALSIGAAF